MSAHWGGDPSLACPLPSVMKLPPLPSFLIIRYDVLHLAYSAKKIWRYLLEDFTRMAGMIAQRGIRDAKVRKVFPFPRIYYARVETPEHVNRMLSMSIFGCVVGVSWTS